MNRSGWNWKDDERLNREYRKFLGTVELEAQAPPDSVVSRETWASLRDEYDRLTLRCVELKRKVRERAIDVLFWKCAFWAIALMDVVFAMLMAGKESR